jgi:hypothetical protein
MPLGFLDVIGDFDDGPVGVDPIDGAVVQLSGLSAPVAWVGEIDPPLLVDAKVVAGLESLALEAIGDEPELAGFHVPAHHGTAAVGALAGDEEPPGVEHQAVRLVAVLSEDCGRLRLRVDPHDHAFVFAERDFREVHGAV